ncbi:MAG: hydrogenase-2 assembly chaperone [[Pasteurella] mairii]|uniref:Hydrogenase-2 operon protein hybE n=1 Tax=[Pasteurella] mairii TaxID=757 RepID=A0A379B599_9PAST|nr:hydrogenase-2 assembly chaperone [[Pasteurella] mairii]SUB33805.1 Hydrogenase-2 operon protein hybE [[Pasteurella] mairii]
MKTDEKATALCDVVQGFKQDPSVLLQQAMENVAPKMHDLPFYRQEIPCFCPTFVLFEQQWIGVVLTPWTLSVVVLPGPEQQWEKREVGEKLLLQLPYKNLVFTVGQLERIPQYLSCSLLSPLDVELTAEQAVQLAKDCLAMILSLPTKQNKPNVTKRNIFTAVVPS